MYIGWVILYRILNGFNTKTGGEQKIWTSDLESAPKQYIE